jgi:hypothetical protein
MMDEYSRPATLEDLKLLRVKDALMVSPDQAAKEIAPEWFEEGENIRVADAFVVEIMLNANGQTFDRPSTHCADTRRQSISTASPYGPSVSKACF